MRSLTKSIAVVASLAFVASMLVARTEVAAAPPGNRIEGVPVPPGDPIEGIPAPPAPSETGRVAFMKSWASRQERAVTSATTETATTSTSLGFVPPAEVGSIPAPAVGGNGFTDSIDFFRGTLRASDTDLRLPQHGKLSLSLNRVYSSAGWNIQPITECAPDPFSYCWTTYVYSFNPKFSRLGAGWDLNPLGELRTSERELAESYDNTLETFLADVLTWGADAGEPDYTFGTPDGESVGLFRTAEGATTFQSNDGLWSATESLTSTSRWIKIASPEGLEYTCGAVAATNDNGDYEDIATKKPNCTSVTEIGSGGKNTITAAYEETQGWGADHPDIPDRLMRIQDSVGRHIIFRHFEENDLPYSDDYRISYAFVDANKDGSANTGEYAVSYGYESLGCHDKDGWVGSVCWDGLTTVAAGLAGTPESTSTAYGPSGMAYDGWVAPGGLTNLRSFEYLSDDDCAYTSSSWGACRGVFLLSKMTHPAGGVFDYQYRDSVVATGYYPNSRTQTISQRQIHENASPNTEPALLTEYVFGTPQDCVPLFGGVGTSTDDLGRVLRVEEQFSWATGPLTYWGGCDDYLDPGEYHWKHGQPFINETYDVNESTDVRIERWNLQTFYDESMPGNVWAHPTDIDLAAVALDGWSKGTQVGVDTAGEPVYKADLGWQEEQEFVDDNGNDSAIVFWEESSAFTADNQPTHQRAFTHIAFHQLTTDSGNADGHHESTTCAEADAMSGVVVVAYNGGTDNVCYVSTRETKLTYWQSGDLHITSGQPDTSLDRYPMAKSGSHNAGGSDTDFDPATGQVTRQAKCPEGATDAENCSEHGIVTKKLTYHTAGVSEKPWGNLATITDADGNTTTVNSYTFGVASSVTSPPRNSSSTGATSGLTMTRDIDIMGLLRSETSWLAPHVTPRTFAYDGIGRLTNITEPYPTSDSAKNEFPGKPDTFVTYDGFSSMALQQGSHTEWTYYDGFGKPIAVGDSLGHSTRTVYDPLGRVDATSSSIGTGRLDITYFDDEGRVRRVERPTVDNTPSVETFSWNEEDSRFNLEHIDATGVRRGYEYNFLTDWDTPLNIRWQMVDDGEDWDDARYYRYGENMQPVKIDGPAGEEGKAAAQDRSLAYDPFGQLYSEETMATGKTTYTYTKSGRLHCTQNASQRSDKRAECLTYDSFGRIRRVDVGTYDSGGDNLTGSVNLDTYSYDDIPSSPGIGSEAVVTSTANASYPSVTKTQFDIAGREVTRTRQFTSGWLPQKKHTTSHRYDATTGQLATLVNPLGRSFTYTYDSLGRLQAMPGWVNEITYVTDDGYPTDTVNTVAYANGRTDSYVYDEQNRVSSVKDSTGEISNQTYDAASRPDRTTRGDTTVSRDFDYDYKGRLIKASSSDPAQGTAEFAYDMIDNMANMTTGGTASDFTYRSNRLATGPATSVSRGYDTNGRLTSISSNSGPTQSFLWDDNKHGSLTHVKDPTSGATLQYNRYDCEGRRVVKVENNKTTIYHWYLGEVSVKSDERDIATEEYVYLDLPQGPRRIATIKNRDAANPIYYSHDLLGMASTIYDKNGAVAGRWITDAYGNVKIREGAAATEQFFFQGKELDTTTGNYYFPGRYYDPTAARFISPDPVVRTNVPPDLQQYAYAHNSPTAIQDTTGNVEDLTPSSPPPPPPSPEVQASMAERLKLEALAKKATEQQEALDAVYKAQAERTPYNPKSPLTVAREEVEALLQDVRTSEHLARNGRTAAERRVGRAAATFEVELAGPTVARYHALVPGEGMMLRGLSGALSFLGAVGLGVAMAPTSEDMYVLWMSVQYDVGLIDQATFNRYNACYHGKCP